MILNDNSTQQINTLVIQLQNKITNLTNEFRKLNNEISDLEKRVSSNENAAAAMNTEISANTEAISGKADKIHTHTKSEITDFPTSLPANGGTADYANKIVPNYTSVALTTVTSGTIKYIKLADCVWEQTGTLQVLLRGNCFEDTLVINFGGGNGLYPMLCGHYSGNSHLVHSVIAQKGSNWNSNYSIYVKVNELENLTVNIALLKGDCTINISESITAPTNIYEWNVGYGLFGNITAPNITNLEQRVAALESKI